MALAACSRPALSVDVHSTDDQFSAALAELVATAEMFGCKPPFWHWATETAQRLGQTADAQKYRERLARLGAGAALK